MFGLFTWNDFKTLAEASGRSIQEMLDDAKSGIKTEQGVINDDNQKAARLEKEAQALRAEASKRQAKVTAVQTILNRIPTK